MTQLKTKNKQTHWARKFLRQSQNVGCLVVVVVVVVVWEFIFTQKTG